MVEIFFMLTIRKVFDTHNLPFSEQSAICNPFDRTKILLYPSFVLSFLATNSGVHCCLRLLPPSCQWMISWIVKVVNVIYDTNILDLYQKSLPIWSIATVSKEASTPA